MPDQMSIDFLRGGLRAAFGGRPKPHELRAYLELLGEEGLDPQTEYERVVQERKRVSPDLPQALSYSDLYRIQEPPMDLDGSTPIDEVKPSSE